MPTPHRAPPRRHARPLPLRHSAPRAVIPAPYSRHSGEGRNPVFVSKQAFMRLHRRQREKQRTRKGVICLKKFRASQALDSRLRGNDG